MELARRPVAFKNLTGNIPFVHVRDVCRAALHLASYPAAEGQAYNVTDDGRLDAPTLVRLVADEMGVRPTILPPVPISATRKVLSTVAAISAGRAKAGGRKPPLEHDPIQYFGRDYLYSNAKLKATGFEFIWPHPEPGIRETLRWYVDHGWLERPRRSSSRRW